MLIYSIQIYFCYCRTKKKGKKSRLGATADYDADFDNYSHGGAPGGRHYGANEDYGRQYGGNNQYGDQYGGTGNNQYGDPYGGNNQYGGGDNQYGGQYGGSLGFDESSGYGRIPATKLPPLQATGAKKKKKKKKQVDVESDEGGYRMGDDDF